MTEKRTILRYIIPVDDQWHDLNLNGPIVHVATRHEDHVEIWVIDNHAHASRTRTFRVVGTGQPLDDTTGKHIGTAVTPAGRFVWHLMEHGSVTHG